MKTIILKGYGYWDVTKFPYGGCFKRTVEDTEVTTGAAFGTEEIEVTFKDGSKGIVRRYYIKEQTS